MEIIIQQKFINMKQAVNSLREVSNSFKNLTGEKAEKCDDGLNYCHSNLINK